jgi:hypothetical protein
LDVKVLKILNRITARETIKNLSEQKYVKRNKNQSPTTLLLYVSKMRHTLIEKHNGRGQP